MRICAGIENKVTIHPSVKRKRKRKLDDNLRQMLKEKPRLTELRMFPGSENLNQLARLIVQLVLHVIGQEFN